MMPMPQQFSNSYAAMMQRPQGFMGGPPHWGPMPVQPPMGQAQPVQAPMQPPMQTAPMQPSNPINPVWGANPQAQPMQGWQGQMPQMQPANNFAALSQMRRPMNLQQ